MSSDDITIQGATERQKTAIRKLCISLGEPVPNVEAMSATAARAYTAKLADLYRQRRGNKAHEC